MNTLIKNYDDGKYYLVDELTAHALRDSARDEPFYAYLSNKSRDRLSDDLVEVKQEGDWSIEDEEDDDY